MENTKKDEVKEQTEYIEGNINCLKRLSFSYLTKMLNMYKIKNLQLKHLYKVDPEDTFKSISEKFTKHFNKRKSKGKKSFYWAFFTYVKIIFLPR